MTALVLSAGGMWAAWEVGAWRVLRRWLQPDLIVGASAGAWNGLAISGGATPEDLEREWMHESMAHVFHARPHRLYEKAQMLCTKYRPCAPFALTMIEVPSLRRHLVRGAEICWEHLAASGSIPGVFPAVKIGGRRYVDGGLRGALPVWAAEKLGATRAIALNVLTSPMFRFVHRIFGDSKPKRGLNVTVIEPSEPLGSIYDAVVWDPKKIARWMDLGERDALRAVSSVRM
jgi:NTE family protein